MVKRTMLVLAVLAVGVSIAIAALAQASTRRTVNAKAQVAIISTQGNNFVSAGTVSGSPRGFGSVVLRGTMTGNKSDAKFRAFGTRGTLSGTTMSTSTPQQGGGSTFTGSGKVTGGTGAYRGATGRFTVTGNLPKNSTVFTFQLVGSVRY